MKKTEKKLSLKKFEIAKLNNLNSILGGKENGGKTDTEDKTVRSTIPCLDGDDPLGAGVNDI